MNYETAYAKAMEILNLDINLLFQRLNFFLVATAFLVAAFATIVTIGGKSNFISIDFVLSLAGFFFSIIYAGTNYLNTRIISKIGEYVRELENKPFGELVEPGMQPNTKVNEIVKNVMDRNNTWSLIPEMLSSLRTLTEDPRTSVKSSVADHTYLVPLFFSGVWLVLFIVLPILIVISYHS